MDLVSIHASQLWFSSSSVPNSILFPPLFVSAILDWFRWVTFQITGGEHARRGMHATMRPKMSNKSKSRTRNVCRSQTLRAAEVKRSAAHASVRQSPYLQKQKQVFILSSLDELGGECGRLQSPLRKNGPAKAHIRQNMTSIFLPYSHLAYTVILT